MAKAYPEVGKQITAKEGVDVIDTLMRGLETTKQQLHQNIDDPKELFCALGYANPGGPMCLIAYYQ